MEALLGIHNDMEGLLSLIDGNLLSCCHSFEMRNYSYCATKNNPPTDSFQYVNDKPEMFLIKSVLPLESVHSILLNSS